MQASIIRSHDQYLSSNYNSKTIVWDARWPDLPGKKTVLIFLHGFKGFKDWGTFDRICDYLALQDLIVVRVNFSHNGTTPENPAEISDLEAFGLNNFTIELDDLTMVMDQIQNGHHSIPRNLIESGRFILMGHSRGGSTAILKAAEDPRVFLLITLSAVADFETRYSPDILREWEKDGVIYVENSRTGQQYPLYYQLYQNTIENRNRLYIPYAASKVAVPWLIVQGTGDQTVSIENARQLLEKNEQAKVFFIEGANHTFGGSHPYHLPQLPDDTVLMLDKVSSFIASGKQLK